MNRNEVYLVKNMSNGTDYIYGNIKLACKNNPMFPYSAARIAMKNGVELYRGCMCMKVVVIERGVIKRESIPADKPKNQ